MRFRCSPLGKWRCPTLINKTCGACVVHIKHFFQKTTLRLQSMHTAQRGTHALSHCRCWPAPRRYTATPAQHSCGGPVQCCSQQPQHGSGPPAGQQAWQVEVQQQQQVEVQQQQQVEVQPSMPWYNQPHPEELRYILKLPPWRFQNLIQQEPSILGYRPETLAHTLEALSEALYMNTKGVTSILEQRPAILLQPHQPVMVLHQLAQLLGRSSQQAAFLLTPHPNLLSLEPQELEQRVLKLCEVMHWPSDDLRQAATAAGVSFLPLLSTPVHKVAQQLDSLTTALDTSRQICAQLIQQRPHLLNMSPAVLRSRLFALAEASSTSGRQLLEQLDQQQIKGLATQLMLSPARIHEQLHILGVLLEGTWQQEALVQLLLRLDGPNALAEAQVRLVTYRSLVRTHEPWKQELLAASDKELAVLLSASHEAIAQARYVLSIGEASAISLLEVVECQAAVFRQRFGDGYVSWLAGRAS